MSKKEFEQTIKISTSFDPSEIIKGLNEIQNLVKGFKGVDSNKLFKQFRIDMANLKGYAETLGKALEKAKTEGLTSPDDVKNLKNLTSEFKKLADIASRELGNKMSEGFTQATEAASEAVSKIKKDIESLKEKIANTVEASTAKDLKFKLGKKETSLKDALLGAKKSEDVDKIEKALQSQKGTILNDLKKQADETEKAYKKAQDALEGLRKKEEELKKGVPLEELQKRLEEITKKMEELPSKFASVALGREGKIAQKIDLSSLLTTPLKDSKLEKNFKEAVVKTLIESKGNALGAAISLTASDKTIKNVSGREVPIKSIIKGVSPDQLEAFFAEIAKIPFADELKKLAEQAQKVKDQMANGSTSTAETKQALADLADEIAQAEKSKSEAETKKNEASTNLANAENQFKDAFSDTAKIKQDLDEIAQKEKEATEEKKKQNETQEKINTNRQKASQQAADLSNNLRRGTEDLENQLKAASSLGKVVQNVGSTFDQLSSRLNYFVSIFTVFRKGRQVIRQTFQDVQNLDKAFSSIAMVTSNTVSGLWKNYSQYADIANKLGQSTESAIEASALYVQQGLAMNDALQLTESTLKLATLSQQDFKTTTKQLTAALRGFNMEMSEANNVTDVYSELAAHAAADVQGIAYSMSKVASIAASSGSSFENTAAFLTQMIETTQEAPRH